MMASGTVGPRMVGEVTRGAKARQFFPLDGLPAAIAVLLSPGFDVFIGQALVGGRTL